MKEKVEISRHILNHRGYPPKMITKFHAFIWQLLKDPESCNWGNEIKIAKELYASFPEIKFWASLNLGFYLRSLAWLKGATGQRSLHEKIHSWKYDKKVDFKDPEVIKYDEKRHGQDTFKKQDNPISNMDFLINHGKKTK